MRLPPQVKPPLYFITTCQPQLPALALVPPTILFGAAVP